MKDGQLLRSVQVTPHSNSINNYHTGTGSVVVMLDAGENVYSKAIQTTKTLTVTRYSPAFSHENLPVFMNECLVLSLIP
jgi:hypothetical protein